MKVQPFLLDSSVKVEFKGILEDHPIFQSSSEPRMIRFMEFSHLEGEQRVTT